MRHAFVIAFCVLLAACVPLEPERYKLARPGVDCSGANAMSEDCRHATTERTPGYDLHFVEFDDQGLQYPDSFMPAKWNLTAEQTADADCDLKDNGCLHQRAWAYQINNLIKQLNTTAEKEAITLIVFVHGWKHGAKAEDQNLVDFRKLLDGFAMIESRRDQFARRLEDEPPRRTVGVYVSWRGAAIDFPGLEELTFWSRKEAAMRVAHGSSRELFARLRGFKCVQNASSTKGPERNCNRPPARQDKVKVILIGHSFGGLILYNSIAGSLVESLTHAFDTNADAGSAYWRFADLAVLINPAFEATRYAPLQRIAASSDYPRYEAPLLVTLTSTTDDATGRWFRIGRRFSTLLERHVDDEEHEANLATVGHHAPYFTHRLEIPKDEDRRECAGWQPLQAGAARPAIESGLVNNLPREYENSKGFFRDRAEYITPFPDLRFNLKKDRPWVRDFCGGTRLTQTKGNVNSPIWNVNAIGHPALLPDHNDIMQPTFIAFVRQLYMDTLFLRGMADDIRNRR